MMNSTHTAPPVARRSFRSADDELNYLNEKLEYWFFERRDSRKATIFADRFEKLLKAECAEGSIAHAEYWALLCEVRGDLVKALKCRMEEVRLIERALALGGPVAEIDYEYLALTMVLLSGLQESHGEHENSGRTLAKAHTLALKHGFPLPHASGSRTRRRTG